MDNYVIFDTRSSGEWEKAHIPGALFLNWESYTHTDDKGIAYRIFPPDRLAALLGQMGVDEHTAVAIYGDADSSWGGEGWAAWLLTYLGHKGPVVLLDGGIQAWTAKKLPLSQGKDDFGKRVSKTYHAVINPNINMETEDLAKQLKAIQIVDTRSFIERIRGSIPGSVHINWTKFYTGDNREPIPHDQLVALLKENGIDPDQPVVYYCTGGVRSAYAWMVHRLAGLGPARNYEGGTEAWDKRK